jgi:hypothetical protein
VNCIDIRTGEIMERYLRGELSDEESQHFEEHYFSCDDCWERLRDLSVTRLELAEPRWAVADGEAVRPGWMGGWTWALAAVLALLAVGVAFWLKDSTPGASEGRWTELAAVEPAPYQPQSLRGPDVEANAFEEAMVPYQRGDYGVAAERLTVVVGIEPQNAAASFYLGVSYLLSGRPREAVESLTRVVDAGESRFLESALWYRAKAWLRQGDVAAAREDFENLASRDGALEAEARSILDQL